MISDRLEKRASTCGLMLLLAAPAVSPAPRCTPALSGPQPPEAGSLPACKHCHVPPRLSPVRGSWFLDAGCNLRTPQCAPQPAGPTPLDASRAPCTLPAHLFVHPWLPVGCSLPGPSPLPHRLLLSL